MLQVLYGFFRSLGLMVISPNPGLISNESVRKSSPTLPDFPAHFADAPITNAQKRQTTLSDTVCTKACRKAPGKPHPCNQDPTRVIRQSCGTSFGARDNQNFLVL